MAFMINFKESSVEKLSEPKRISEKILSFQIAMQSVQVILVFRLKRTFNNENTLLDIQ
ncbi:TPA: hypothetical protein HA244_01880 [Candidatus Micrarchaeota archaeon]|nr:hypothetical protein [Candidatus Micrarchaeota archaeon]